MRHAIVPCLILTTMLMGTTGCRAAKADPSAPDSPASSVPAAKTLTEKDAMKLVWSDEFDKDGLPDPAKWGYEVGMLRNKELQWYTKDRLDNARVEGGNLVITARKEPYGNAGYTSASLNTRATFPFTYGRIEVRAKLPTGRGTWPAIWTLGVDHETWPVCGEIDIMEHVGFDPDQVHATVHTGAYNHLKNTHKGHAEPLPKAAAEFHVFAADWTTTGIAFFLDGKQISSYPNDGKGDRETWPFTTPQYLLLNLAIGGGWGGAQGIDDSVFPATYLIDYVRIYQKR